MVATSTSEAMTTTTEVATTTTEEMTTTTTCAAEGNKCNPLAGGLLGIGNCCEGLECTPPPSNLRKRLEQIDPTCQRPGATTTTAEATTTTAEATTTTEAVTTTTTAAATCQQNSGDTCIPGSNMPSLCCASGSCQPISNTPGGFICSPAA
jgi:hypothetical protein